MPIQEVLIADVDNWTSKHLHSIRSAYGNSPYFDFYYQALELRFQECPPSLFEFNRVLLDYFLEALGIDRSYHVTDKYLHQYRHDTLDMRTLLYQSPTLPDYKAKKYNQVFEEKHGFISGLSILDLLMCKGPESILYI